MAPDEEAVEGHVHGDVDGTALEGAGPVDFTRDLIRWSESLAGIARTGLGFTQSLYEQERYEEVLKVAADIKAAADDA
ncbi:MAG TPA: NUDIX hydrolase N-terminal domain-containing protein, partial [Acidimicrobiales bacterium]